MEMRHTPNGSWKNKEKGPKGPFLFIVDRALRVSRFWCEKSPVQESNHGCDDVPWKILHQSRWGRKDSRIVNQFNLCHYHILQNLLVVHFNFDIRIWCQQERAAAIIAGPDLQGDGFVVEP